MLAYPQFDLHSGCRPTTSALLSWAASGRNAGQFHFGSLGHGIPGIGSILRRFQSKEVLSSGTSGFLPFPGKPGQPGHSQCRLYEKLIRFSKELETKVAERTLELKNKSLELSEANRALKEMDRLKTEFLANVSHELRTPLNSILGFTLNLLDGVDGSINEEQRNSLQKVEKASNRLLQLINDVLDLSKLRAGRMELNAEKTSLHGILEEALQTIEPLAQAKEIRP